MLCRRPENRYTLFSSLRALKARSPITNREDSMGILDNIMKPRAVAVIGASTRAHTIGSDLMKRLTEYLSLIHI